MAHFRAVYLSETNDFGAFFEIPFAKRRIKLGNALGGTRRRVAVGQRFLKDRYRVPFAELVAGFF